MNAHPSPQAILIAPSDRPNLAFICRHRPLALLPIAGRSLLDLWLAELSNRGISRVLILASDRPEQIRHAAGRGERWGLSIRIAPETRELTAGEALGKHVEDPGGDTPPAAAVPVFVLDRLPGGEPWTDVAGWFRAVRGRLELAAHQTVGIREITPGVFVHVRARVARDAELRAPCWIGSHAFVGAGAVVGPDTVIEDGAYVDDRAEVSGSFVGPATYVGSMTELRDSIAWDRALLKWTTGSATVVPDDFLLGALGRRRTRARTSWPGRAAALILMILSCPVLLAAWLARRGKPVLSAHTAVRAPVEHSSAAETFTHYELAGMPALLRRWPELWNIVRGDLAWIGNRPLTPDQAASLSTDFERLWLAVPPGILSLGDVEGCIDPEQDEGRAHASYYAVRRGPRTDLAILWRALTHSPLDSQTLQTETI